MAKKGNIPPSTDKEAIMSKRELLADPKFGETRGANSFQSARDQGGARPLGAPQAPYPPKKPSKKQRKAEARREKEVEERLVNEGRIAVRYERRSFLSNAIMMTVALLLGIIIGLGGLIGGLLFAATKMSLKDVSDMANIQYQDYVTEAYANYSLLDLVVEMVDDIKASEDLSLDTVGKYTPVVDNVVSGLLDEFDQLGIKVNQAELTATPFSKLADYFQDDLLPAIELGGVIGVTPSSDNITKMLCYGKEGVDYKIENDAIVPIEGSDFPLTIGMVLNDLEDILFGFELGALMDLDASSDSIVLSLCYGEQGVDYTVENGKIVPAAGATPLTVRKLIDDATDVLMDLKIQSILNVDASASSVMRYLAFGSEAKKDEHGAYILEEDGKPTGHYYIDGDEVKMLTDPATQKPYEKRSVRDLTSEEMITGAKIGDLITVDESTSGLIASVKDWTIDDLTKQDNMEKLVLGDLLTIDENATGLMGAIKDWTIGDLKEQDKLEALTIGDVLDVEADAVGLMGAIKSWTIGDLKDQSKLEALAVGDVLNVSDDAQGLMGAIKDWTIGNLKQQGRIERLKIKDVITVGEGASALMQAIKDWRIMDLTDQKKLDTLTLSDVMTIEEGAPKILQSLKDVPIGGFSDAVNELTLGEVLGGEDDNLEKNKMLRALLSSTLSSLPSDLEALSLEDVFREDIYKYAKKSTYDPAKRTQEDDLISFDKENPISSKVETRYYAGSIEVISGYFTRSGNEGNYTYTLTDKTVKTDAEIAKNNRKPGATYQTPYYIETKTEVNPVYGAWQFVDYDRNVLVPLTAEQATWELTPDSESEAHYIKDGVRYDFERLVAGYAFDSGAAVPEGANVSEHRGVYTLTERTPVYERYYKESDPATTYGAAEVQERFFARVAEGNVTAGEELTRYLGGLWYILVGDTPEGAKCPVLELSKQVTAAIEHLNDMTLEEMYVRELINKEPDVDITRMHFPKEEGGEYTNLNELTISQVIDLVTHIATLIS